MCFGVCLDHKYSGGNIIKKRKKMMNRLFNYIKKWWKKHIADDCPPHLDDEFTDKFR